MDGEKIFKLSFVTFFCDGCAQNTSPTNILLTSPMRNRTNVKIPATCSFIFTPGLLRDTPLLVLAASDLPVYPVQGGKAEI
jgi:hypothetical protein